VKPLRVSLSKHEWPFDSLAASSPPYSEKSLFQVFLICLPASSLPDFGIVVWSAAKSRGV
jgi:hypothetical protein